MSDIIVTVMGSGVADFAAAEQTKPKASVAGCWDCTDWPDGQSQTQAQHL
jgi:hypothetical protein